MAGPAARGASSAGAAGSAGARQQGRRQQGQAAAGSRGDVSRGVVSRGVVSRGVAQWSALEVACSGHVSSSMIKAEIKCIAMQALIDSGRIIDEDELLNAAQADLINKQEEKKEKSDTKLELVWVAGEESLIKLKMQAEKEREEREESLLKLQMQAERERVYREKKKRESKEKKKKQQKMKDKG
ncbi:unconventional myosin-VI-like [Macrobrachium nipponense]|uniref:unconventional myosin-VI-like n=1 Tax=Macrobrachium nipponense TaxID=159736 RepID=UPI0030C824D1